MSRLKISSGSPYESPIGFCRALKVGNTIYVSGTGPIAVDGTTAGPGNAYKQAYRCLQIISEAIGRAGGKMGDVVRTRMYITDAAIWEEVGRAHGEFFRAVRPASTMVIVKGLIRDDWLVEIEAEAVLGA